MKLANEENNLNESVISHWRIMPIEVWGTSKNDWVVVLKGREPDSYETKQIIKFVSLNEAKRYLCRRPYKGPNAHETLEHYNPIQKIFFLSGKRYTSGKFVIVNIVAEMIIIGQEGVKIINNRPGTFGYSDLQILKYENNEWKETNKIFYGKRD